MMLEVRQLIIKATVIHDSNAGAKSQGTDANPGSAELIKACVEKVMELIREKNGR